MAEQPAGEVKFYIGTYTEEAPVSGGRSEGIYRATLRMDTGEIVPEGLAAEMTNPTFLAIDATGRRLYALSKVVEHGATQGGAISAFTIEPASGALSWLNEQPSGGAGPAHISLDATGRILLAANYAGGSVASLPIAPDGRLGPPSQVVQHVGSGPIKNRQDGPHAHAIIAHRDNRFALATDLGTDRIIVYRIDQADRRINPTPVFEKRVRPGTGPRHLAFGPSGRTLYASGELSSTLLVYEFDGRTGELRDLQELSTLPDDWEGENTASEVAVSPDGKFVFVGNRGQDGIAVFHVDEARTLMPGGCCYSTGGSVPRHFALDPSGRWLVVANQKSDNVVVLSVDQESGELQPTGHEIRVPVPVCIKFL